MRVIVILLSLCAGVYAGETSPRTEAIESYIASVEAPKDEEPWRYRVSLYLWAADMDGDLTVAGVTLPIDVPFSETLEKLELAASTRFAARKGRWALIVDLFYLAVRDDAPVMGTTVTGKVKWFIGELSVNYRVLEVPLQGDRVLRIHLAAGGRYHHLKAEVGVGGGPSGGTTENFIDPIVGFDIRLHLEKWTLMFRADVGGFGLESELTWKVLLAAERRISERTAVGIAYAVLDIDRDDGPGGNRFNLDVRTQGPAFYVAFFF